MYLHAVHPVAHKTSGDRSVRSALLSQTLTLFQCQNINQRVKAEELGRVTCPCTRMKGVTLRTSVTLG